MACDEINKSEIFKKIKTKMSMIGSRIRILRKQKGITQQDLAFFIFSDKSLISEMERGNSKNVTLFTLMKISDVLDINVDELFCD